MRKSNNEKGANKAVYVASNKTANEELEVSQDSLKSSARFYKALKDFQQFSDANVLKEELWTCRKELTSLEQKLLEKSSELLELKKLFEAGPLFNYSEFQRALEKEKNINKLLESENSSLKEAALKPLEIFQLIKEAFARTYKEICGKADAKYAEFLMRMKKYEDRLYRVFERIKLMVIEGKRHSRESLEIETKERDKKIAALKNKNFSIARLMEIKKSEEEQKYNCLCKEHKELCNRIQDLEKENILLTDLNKVLDLENVKTREYVESLERKLKGAEEEKLKIKQQSKYLERKEKKIQIENKKINNYIQNFERKGNQLEHSSKQKENQINLISVEQADKKTFEKYKRYKQKYNALKKSAKNSIHEAKLSKYEKILVQKDSEIREIVKQCTHILSDYQSLRQDFFNSASISANNSIDLETSCRKEKSLEDLDYLTKQYEKLLKEYHEAKNPP